jgi:hypothetical protein
MIEVIDNFLPDDYFQHLKSILMAEDRPMWALANYTVGCGEPERDRNMQMVHMIYADNLVYSDMFGQLQPLFNALNLAVAVRIKANMTFREPESQEMGWHVDFGGNMPLHNITTAILYLNDTDGGTRIEGEDETISCKENRLVRFPAEMKHTAMSMTNAKQRVVLNINYIAGV